jgi:hypothetical protein
MFVFPYYNFMPFTYYFEVKYFNKFTFITNCFLVSVIIIKSRHEMGTTTENFEDVGNSEETKIFIQPTTTQESSLQTKNFSHFQPQTSIPSGSSNSNSTHDEYIRFGSCISLQHNTTSRYLSSRSPDNKESSKGNKDQVCLKTKNIIRI